MRGEQGYLNKNMICLHCILSFVSFCPSKPKKKKNINHDVFGTKLGRIHMESQDFDTLQIRKMKALKRQKPADDKKEDNKEVDSKKSRTDEAAKNEKSKT